MFENIDFRNADFRETWILGDATYKGCDLRWADFSEAELESAYFENCDLCNAILRGSNMPQIQFCSCNIEDADLSGATMYHAYFYETDIDSAITNEAKDGAGPRQKRRAPPVLAIS